MWMWLDGSPKYWSIKWYPGRPKKGKSLISRSDIIQKGIAKIKVH